jgi:hypothetical protein
MKKRDASVQLVTFYNFLYIFISHLFQIYQKPFGSLDIYCFVENFKRYLLIKKKCLSDRDDRGEILKILRGPFFLGHPLREMNFFIRNNFVLWI